MTHFMFRFKHRGYRHFDSPISHQHAWPILSDPVLISRHAFLPFLSRDIKIRRYKKRIKKVVPKVRPIKYASHLDSAIYDYYATKLGPSYEQHLLLNDLENIPIAYRKFPSKKCNIDFALEAFSFISRSTVNVTTLCFDIESFFDSIDHKLLRECWSNVIGEQSLPDDHYAVFKSLTRYSFVPQEAVFKIFDIKPQRNSLRTRICSTVEFRSRIADLGFISRNTDKYGIPQGSSMSGVLSNIYMLPFDKILKSLEQHYKAYARRYSDDIIVIVPTEHAQIAMDAVNAACNERRLKLQEAKSERVDFIVNGSSIVSSHSVQYLGFTFDGENILIRSQTLSRYYRRLRQKLKKNARLAGQRKRPIKSYRKYIFESFVHTGKRNFLKYSKRSLNVTGSQGIRNQMKRHAKTVNRWISEFEQQS